MKQLEASKRRQRYGQYRNTTVEVFDPEEFIECGLCLQHKTCVSVRMVGTLHSGTALVGCAAVARNIIFK